MSLTTQSTRKRVPTHLDNILYIVVSTIDRIPKLIIGPTMDLEHIAKTEFHDSGLLKQVHSLKYITN